MYSLAPEMWDRDKWKFLIYNYFYNDHVIMKITKIFYYENLEPYGNKLEEIKAQEVYFNVT